MESNETNGEMKNEMNGGEMKGSYGKFGLMLAVSFVIMYAVMFLNVSEFDHIYLSINRFYMTLLMVAPMSLVMMGLMRGMYPNKKANLGIIAAGIVVLILAFICLRTQAFVGDRQYMRGMIPHHSSAIMTSTHADLQDPEVKKLSQDIIEAQEREIALMKQLLEKTK
ncbi:MAG: DUF305 domain-containing protein [Pyrinomonadaceae bacterium]